MQATGASTQASSADLAQEMYTVFAYLLASSTPDLFAVLSEIDVSLTQVKLLHTLDKPGADHSLKSLAEELSLSLPAASRAIDGLHQRGLVERREDERDRRMKRVAIAPGGREVLGLLNAMRIEQLERFADTMTEPQRRRLLAALAPLLERDEIAAHRPKDGAR